jgi:hypothetical protein
MDCGYGELDHMVVEGDVRNALPVGQKVQTTLRKQHGQNVLADVMYPKRLVKSFHFCSDNFIAQSRSMANWVRRRPKRRHRRISW